MRIIKQELREEFIKFFKILYKEYPELQGEVEYSVEFNISLEYGGIIRYYDFELQVPLEYRNQVLTISKFCDLGIVHEIHDSSKGICIFSN